MFLRKETPLISTGDPLFRKVWANLSKEERQKLMKECRYGR